MLWHDNSLISLLFLKNSYIINRRKLIAKKTYSKQNKPYHFHRIFLAGTHETVGSYIKKRRFTLIGDRLHQTNDKVIDVAYDCHYESHEAFTRAFKSYFYQTPSQYRKSNRENPFLRLDRLDQDFL